MLAFGYVVRCTCTWAVTELTSVRRRIQLCMSWVGYFVSVEDEAYSDHEPERPLGSKSYGGDCSAI